MRKENDLIFAVFKTNVLDQAQLGINVQWYFKIARAKMFNDMTLKVQSLNLKKKVSTTTTFVTHNSRHHLNPCACTLNDILDLCLRMVHQQLKSMFVCSLEFHM